MPFFIRSDLLGEKKGFDKKNAFDKDMEDGFFHRWSLSLRPFTY